MLRKQKKRPQQRRPRKKTAAEEEDEENYDTGDAALDNTRNQDEIGEKNF